MKLLIDELNDFLKTVDVNNFYYMEIMPCCINLSAELCPGVLNVIMSQDFIPNGTTETSERFYSHFRKGNGRGYE